jgi:hypothetical protein
MRDTAAAFAAACAELSSALEECSALIGKGRARDAAEKNNSFSPSLIERAEKLRFERLDDWAGFCREYGWDVPAPPAEEAIEKLRRAVHHEEILAPLLDEWRKVARGGAAARKLEILRKLEKNDPGNSAWTPLRDELEKERRAQLVESARAAIEAGNLEELEKIHLEMVSPAFRLPPDPKPLAKIEEILRAKHEAAAAAEGERILRALGEAYSMFDFAAVSRALGEWDTHISNPVYKPGPNELAQVSDARNWLDSQSKLMARERNRETWTRDLELSLDERKKDIPKIEGLYYKLVSSDMEISPVLAERVEEARRQDAEDKSKTARNRIIIGVAAALAAAALGVVAINYYSVVSEKRSAFAHMRSAIETGDYEKGLALAEKFAPKFPDSAEITAFRKDFEKMKTERVHLDSVFEKKRAALEKLMTPADADSKVCDQLTAELESLKSPVKSSGQEEALSALKEKTAALRAESQRKRDAAHRRSAENLSAMADTLGKQTPGDAAAIAAFKKEFDRVSKAADELRAARGVSAPLFESSSRLAAAALDSLRTKLDLASRRAELIDDIWKANDPDEYAKLLERLQTESGADWELFSRASRDINIYRVVCLPSKLWRDTAAPLPDELPEKLGALPAEDNLWRGDINRLALRKKELEEVKTINERLRNFAENSCNLYETVFSAKNGRKCRFYSLKPPSAPRKDQSKPASGMRIEAMTKSEDEAPTVFEFQLCSINDNKMWQPKSGQPASARLPQEFDGDLNFDVRETPVKARHYYVINEASGKIRAALASGRKDEVTSAVIAALNTLKTEKNMNPAVRLIVCRDLLMMMKILCPESAVQTDIKISELTAARPEGLDWRSPFPEDWVGEQKMSAAVDTADTAGLAVFSSLARDVSKTALTRNLAAAAKIEMKNGKPSVRLSGADWPSELWAAVRGADGTPELRLAAVKKPGGGDPALKDGEYFNGQMLFAPRDARSTQELAAGLKTEAAKAGQGVPWTRGWPVNARN